MPKAMEAVAENYFLGQVATTRQLAYMATFNLLLIASAYIQIPLPFSPVPVTAQTMAVLGCGLFLGPIWGAVTVLAYLLEGSLGLPVFAGGTAGLAKLIGPTGGYLLGFVPAAYLVGFLSQRLKSMSYWRLLLALVSGTAVIFGCGLLMLSIFTPKGNVLVMGLYPFLPGAAVKILALTSLLAGYKKIRRSI